MKKTTVGNWLPPGRKLYKLLIFMKISMLLVTLACLHVSAKVHSQSTITLKIPQMALDKALTLLEKTARTGLFITMITYHLTVKFRWMPMI